VGLDKDEREDFLRRENELSDQLAEKERVLSAAEKLVSELKEELSFLKDQEASLSNVRPFRLIQRTNCDYFNIQENKAMSGQLNELRLQVERLNYDSKESGITIDILKEQNEDAKAELEELKKTISELRSSQKDASADDKEKRKQEKMAMMMAKFDTVSFLIPSFPSVLLFVTVGAGLSFPGLHIRDVTPNPHFSALADLSNHASPNCHPLLFHQMML
jgi:kinesin family protein 5